MNGGMTECTRCDCDPCRCACIKAGKELKRITDGKEAVEIAIDVFAKAGRWRMKIIKWILPDIQRLADALYDYWDKS